jgi:hypothetical protein
VVLWRFKQHCISGIYFKSDFGLWIVVDRYRQIVLIALEYVETSLDQRDWNIHFHQGFLNPVFVRFGASRQSLLEKSDRLANLCLAPTGNLWPPCNGCQKNRKLIN